VGYAPLHWAADQGHVEIVNILLKFGADVDIKTNDNETPLHFAAWMGRPKVVKILLENGADVNARERMWLTPLDKLVSHVKKPISKNYLEAAKILLENGASPYLRNKFRMNAFEFASSNNLHELVKIMIYYS